jgi:hypothetical protein
VLDFVDAMSRSAITKVEGWVVEHYAAAATVTSFVRKLVRVCALVQRVDFERMECPNCGERFSPDRRGAEWGHKSNSNRHSSEGSTMTAALI